MKEDTQQTRIMSRSEHRNNYFFTLLFGLIVGGIAHLNDESASRIMTVLMTVPLFMMANMGIARLYTSEDSKKVFTWQNLERSLLSGVIFASMMGITQMHQDDGIYEILFRFILQTVFFGGCVTLIPYFSRRFSKQ